MAVWFLVCLEAQPKIDKARDCNLCSTHVSTELNKPVSEWVADFRFYTWVIAGNASTTCRAVRGGMRFLKDALQNELNALNPTRGKVRIRQREEGVEFEGGGRFAVCRRGHLRGWLSRTTEEFQTNVGAQGKSIYEWAMTDLYICLRRSVVIE